MYNKLQVFWEILSLSIIISSNQVKNISNYDLYKWYCYLFLQLQRPGSQESEAIPAQLIVRLLSQGLLLKQSIFLSAPDLSLLSEQTQIFSQPLSRKTQELFFSFDYAQAYEIPNDSTKQGYP